MPNQEGLRKSYKKRTKDSTKKAMEAIEQLRGQKKPVNFSTVANASGVSRHFLYTNEAVRKVIEEQRGISVNNDINRRAKFDKTSKGKDVIIKAKDKRISQLLDENASLKSEIRILRGLLYGRQDKELHREHVPDVENTVNPGL